MKHLTGALMFVSVALVSTNAAAQVLLDFADTRHDDTAIASLGSVYQDQDFQLTAFVYPGSGNTPDFASLGTLRFDYDGEPSIYNANAQGGIELTRSDGGQFSLYSIDLAELPNGQITSDGSVIALPAPGPFSITFTGTLVSGRTVTTTAIVQPFPTVLLFVFPKEFHNLISVTWTQGPGGTSLGLATHQFSNIEVEGVGSRGRPR